MEYDDIVPGDIQIIAKPLKSIQIPILLNNNCGRNFACSSKT